MSCIAQVFSILFNHWIRFYLMNYGGKTHCTPAKLSIIYNLIGATIQLEGRIFSLSLKSSSTTLIAKWTSAFTFLDPDLWARLNLKCMKPKPHLVRENFTDPTNSVFKTLGNYQLL